MDALDTEIIHQLRRDGRAAYTSIAEMVGASEATVRTRVRRLVEEGTIRQFTVRVRGANLRALIEVAIETNVITSEVASRIRELAGVEEVWELTGDFDIAAICSADGTDELNELVEGIRAVGSIRSTRTRVILNEIV